MPSPKAVLGPLLTATLLLGAPHAEARFGKRSRPSASPSNSSQQERGPTQSERSERVHPATAIGREDEAPREDSPRRRSSSRRVPASGAVVVSGASASAASPRLFATSRAERRRDEPVPLLVRLGVQSDVIKEGASMSLFMAMEGRRMGLDTRITGMTLKPDNGAEKDTKDRITLLSARVTAALWASSRGRMRVEAGLTSAHAPKVIFVGPSFGASAEACIGRSPLDIEVRVNATPFPHRQVDLQAGMALHLSAFNVRGGWRALYLNDAGHVDGVEHEESLVGPYMGVGLTF